MRLDAAMPGQPITTSASSSWLHWIYAEAGPSTIVGLLIITAVLTVSGYALSALGWRLWIARKWKRRHA